MRLGPCGGEQGGLFQSCCCVRQFFSFRVSESQVQIQIPIVKAQSYSLAIFVDFFRITARHAVSKTQMVMCQRVVWMQVQHMEMQLDCSCVVFESERCIK